MRDRLYRIGTGAGFSADRLDPAADLVERGRLDAIVFECVGERTLAFAHRDRRRDPALGFNPWLERRMKVMLPLCARHGTKLITNMGAANPRAAAAKTRAVADALGLSKLRVAWIEGDDVTDRIEMSGGMVGANAYIGADALMPALAEGADVIVAGRVADPSLFLAPLMMHFGWRADDWPLLGRGTLVGHLMECAAQITGGYFADPGRKDVPDLAHVGFPIAEVSADGDATITKLDRTGGEVSVRTVKEQLLYEVHDPTAYLTPDVTADFSKVSIAATGADRVRLAGAGGRKRPDNLKVTVAMDGGYLAEAEVSYAGPGAGRRAELAGAVVKQRMAGVQGFNDAVRIDLIGVASLLATADRRGDVDLATDARLRCALRTGDRAMAEALLWEVESLLTCGPAGGGGYRGRIDPSVTTETRFLDRGLVPTRVHWL
ncbi:MAG: DUF1446 domain-containing protein [Alphaproteobacteria bacterium]|nr:DUF1446 domain-containing protein [Alphaproteobacteria bacterium]